MQSRHYCQALQYLRGEVQGSDGFAPVDMVDVHVEARKHKGQLISWWPRIKI